MPTTYVLGDNPYGDGPPLFHFSSDAQRWTVITPDDEVAYDEVAARHASPLRVNFIIFCPLKDLLELQSSGNKDFVIEHYDVMRSSPFWGDGNWGIKSKFGGVWLPLPPQNCPRLCYTKCKYERVLPYFRYNVVRILFVEHMSRGQHPPFIDQRPSAEDRFPVNLQNRPCLNFVGYTPKFPGSNRSE